MKPKEHKSSTRIAGVTFSLNPTQKHPPIPSPQSVKETSESFAADFKIVPSLREDRLSLRTLVVRQVSTWPGQPVLSRAFLEEQSRQLLSENGLTHNYLGWVMVALASQYWKSEIARIPRTRRLLLLPHCLRNSQSCQGSFEGDLFVCAHCGQCVLDSLIDEGISLGYQVLVAEGTPIVMRSILSGKADAILGVGCLNSLERVFEKLLAAGIPAMAVPLFESRCKDTQTDLDEIRSMIEIPWNNDSIVPGMPSWLPLFRLSNSLFELNELERIMGYKSITPFSSSNDSRERSSSGAFSDTQAWGIDFLVSGGKYYRPFMTLAAYDVATRGIRTLGDGKILPDEIPLSVRRAAVAMEFFHKASLVHDDIEDDDLFRYGRPTLHRKTGIPTAVNIGDYLLGEGYRLIAADSELSPSIRLDILRRLSDCHVKLCKGQGTELFWTNHSGAEVPEAADVLNMYSLKTAPAFRAAIYTGFRLAMDDETLAQVEPIVDRLSKYWGIAFQIRNDLLDWRTTSNKEQPGNDFFGRRPTILRSFAQAGLSSAEWSGLESLERLSSENEENRSIILSRVRRLYLKANAFTKAEQLIEKYRLKCLATIQRSSHFPWASFFEYLTGVIAR